MSLFKSLFQSNFINPSEYTINSKDGTTTYIKDEVVKSKSQLSELCILVCPQLSADQKNLKQIVKSAKTVLDEIAKHADKFRGKLPKTHNITEFFQCIDIIKADYARMSEIEAYVYYGKLPSNIALYQFEQRLQVEIRHLIDRTYAHSRTLKNPTAATKKQFADFQEYLSIMDEQTIKKLHSKYKTDAKKYYYKKLAIILRKISEQLSNKNP